MSVINRDEMLRKTGQFFLLLMIFSLISLIPCVISYYSQLERSRLEKQEISEKVLSIMRMYNCDNLEIHEAIMATFDPVLVAVVIAVESEYRIDAVSRVGCRGLMQLSPDKLEDWQNIRKNIQTGSAYLETQLKRFGNLELAFAAYNAGPEMVLKYQGVPPFRETITYIEKAKSFGLAFNNPELDRQSNLTDQRKVSALL